MVRVGERNVEASKKKLKELGVMLSMDDFGSGYSSLNVLTKLPLDVLKLDKEFMRDFDTDSEEKIVIPSVIDMAKKLKLEVVCEGVETKEELLECLNLGIDLLQGYYLGRPQREPVNSIDAKIINEIEEFHLQKIWTSL